MRIRSVEPISCGKMLGAVYGFIGLIAGALMALLAGLGMALNPTSAKDGSNVIFALFFGVGAIVFWPILYAIFGMIGGLLAAIFYNLAAKMMGGIQIDLE